MAMIERFIEDADMFLVPFVGGRLAAPAQLYSWSVPSSGNRHFCGSSSAMWGETAPIFGATSQPAAVACPKPFAC